MQIYHDHHGNNAIEKDFCLVAKKEGEVEIFLAETRALFENWTAVANA